MDWGKSIRKKNVLIGANFASNNGIGRHIHAIKKYLGDGVALFPSDKAINRISAHEFVTLFEKHLQDFSPSKDVILHSHVYPWFIKWCHEQQKKGSKWIHTYHLPYSDEHGGNDIAEWQQEFNRCFVEVASQADVKLSVSKWQQAYYRDNHNIDTVYLPNGVDVKKCDSANPAEFINEIGFSHYILNVSRNDPVKNPGEFVHLAQIMPLHKFVIIGPGLSAQVFASDYNISVPRNLLIYGEASHEMVQNAIAACSVLVSNAKKEGLPTLVLEGMTHGKSVVVSNEPGSMEVIAHGKYGSYYTLGSIPELKEKVEQAFEDNQIRVKGRQRVLEEYDWRVVAIKLDGIYRGVK